MPNAEARRPTLRHTPDGLPLSELAAIVSEYGCTRTLAVGLGRGEWALAIGAAHQRRDDGRLMAIVPVHESEHRSEGLGPLRDAGLLERVQFIGDPPELALPALLQRDTELDLAVIVAPDAFEDAFLQCLYIDRMLVTGGILVLDNGSRAATEAIVEFLALSRAYEQRSTARSRLVVLRKLGRHRPASTPVPTGWSESTSSYRHRRDDDRGVASHRALEVVPGQGAPSLPTSTREVYLLRARVSELQGAVRQLQARLLEAELDASRELDDLRDQLQAAKTAHEQAEYWLACITSSPSWQLTAPLRVLKRLGRRLTRG